MFGCLLIEKIEDEFICKLCQNPYILINNICTCAGDYQGLNCDI